MKDRAAETRLFEQAPIVRAVLALAIPTVISQIILVIYNMADTFFIGLAGSDAMITAVTVCMPAFMFLSAISNLFGVGGASVIARALGGSDPKKARDTAAFAFWGCAAVTLVYSLGARLFMDTFVDLLGGSDPAVHGSACQYLTWTVVLGGLATSLNALLGHLVRSEGHSVQAGFGIALGGVLNIGLDPLFMFVLLPKGSEVLGAAIATSLSNLVATLYFLSVIYANRRRSVLSLRPGRAALRNGIPGEVLATGLPACLMTLCENISYAVLDNLMALSGTVMQAGLGVAKKVNMLAHCMARGMAQGVLPLIGYNYAAGNYRRMRDAVRISTAISVALSTLWMAASLLLCRRLVGLFIQHGSDSVRYGARFLQILCIGGPFSACAYAVISFFQAVGESRKSFILAVLRKGILDIPMMFILLRLIPTYGIVWATPIADVLCCATAVTLFTAFTRRLLARPRYDVYLEPARR
ncbi:MAG: MATE family efflux transporter [Clostridia bacterium]|nr:MATE family efflux transporter [Clostridia bacterium]